MKKTREFLVWTAAFIFWCFGAILLRRIWNYQKSLPDPMGSYIEFTVMFLATFYPLALFVMKSRVEWVFSQIGSESPVIGNESPVIGNEGF